ncbi:MAG: hypothetical protein NTV22_14565 [bacterium]|nr:hypothetical protein [bacterium]
MQAISITASDVRSLDEFPLRWRWTQSSHALFPEHELKLLIPLTSATAVRVCQLSAALCGRNGLHTEVLVNIVESDARQEEPARAWLAALPVSRDTQVIVSWDRATALMLPWWLFVCRWDDFCYPAADDVTVLPINGGWLLVYFHFELLQWGRTTAPAHQ